MKKSTIKNALQSAMLFSVVMTMATACSSDDQYQPEAPSEGKTVIITATQASSRMAYNNAGAGYWQSGDKLTVSSETGTTVYTSTFDLTEGAGAASATFSG